MITRSAVIADYLRQRLFSGLHLGLLSHGERLPSVREIARELHADARAVLAAYRALEKERLVEARPRSGMFVASAAVMEGGLPERSDWIVDALLCGVEGGVGLRDASDVIAQCVDTVRLRAVVLECNDDQLYSVPEELRRDYGLVAAAVDINTILSIERLPPEIRGADLLVTTRFHGPDVQRIAERVGVARIEITMCTELFAEVARLLRQMPVYFVVVDPRFARKLRDIFASSDDGPNLRVLICQRDDLSQIPADAPVYFTRLARQRVGDTPLLRRVLPEARVFSRESSAQLLSFIVRANLAASTGASAATA